MTNIESNKYECGYVDKWDIMRILGIGENLAVKIKTEIQKDMESRGIPYPKKATIPLKELKAKYKF